MSWPELPAGLDEREVQMFDEDACCECGGDHDCHDCPVFGGDGVTPGWPHVAGKDFVEYEGVRILLRN